MVEEVKGDKPRLERLKTIEREMRDSFLSNKLYEQEAPEGYESMPVEEKNAGKFMATFPFPYMNGYLHLGHAFTITKSEFMTRYQRQIGKRVLFPFAFHCTGMPISSAAIRLEREIRTGATCSNQPSDAEKEAMKKKGEKIPPLTQFEILQQLEIPDDQIPRFCDPNYWLEFFPPLGREVLHTFGIHTDWRRSFITTAKNPYFDQFIRWQFHHLKANGKIKFGKRYTVYSCMDQQACADHDRAEGEGVTPQEYTGIKIKLLEFPESLAAFQDREVFLVAATLRPETMYGQTNCFILPEGEYGLYEMKNNELFIVSERAAKHFAYQEMTAVEKEYPCLAKVRGQELIGKKLKAPLTSYEFVHCLPLPTISMTKGTGIVTSVPSDSPDDFAMLRDLQEKQGLREKLGVDESWVSGFDPIPIIQIEGMGNLSAKFAVEELKIQSHKDAAKLREAKDKCYQEGFSKGVMIVGLGEGRKVEDVKPEVRKHMIEVGLAVPYYEPEKQVLSRTGDDCIVALCDQWLLDYGEESWKTNVKSHVSSGNFETYNPKTQKEFELILEWLKEWGCSRTVGLGTRVPWDEQFVIESLSDSTIYTSFYTIAHLLQGGVMEGTGESPAGIPADAMTIEAFDYVFLGKEYNAEKCPGVSQETLDRLRREFEFWYPMDLRVSGKDLIRNHLTMALYNHQAIWQNEAKMPRGYFCNGYLMLNSEKMSKSTGNFMTLEQCMTKYGTDASRFALADAGDTLDDANFVEDVANSAVLKLFVLEQWIENNFPKDQAAAPAEADYTLWDKIMINQVNIALRESRAAYDEMKFKAVIKQINELINIKESYLIATGGQKNPAVLSRFVEALLTMLNPICPHFSQYVWQTHVFPHLSKVNHNAQESLIANGWPASEAHQPVLSAQLKYLGDLKSTIRLSLEKAASGGKKKGKGGKKGAAAPAEEAKAPLEKCVIAVGTEFPAFQKTVLEILSEQEFDGDAIVGNAYIQAVRGAITDKKQAGLAMKFAAFVVKEATEVGKEQALQLQMPFNELELAAGNQTFLFDNMKVTSVQVVAKEDEAVDAAPNGRSAADAAVPGKPIVLFY